MVSYLIFSAFMDWFYQIHKAFRCCLHCGSFSCQDSLFCNYCERNLLETHNGLSEFNLESSIQGTAMFDWFPDQDRKVSKLMVALKGGRLNRTLDLYARIYVSRLFSGPPTDCVLVPCPSSSKNPDHALKLAQSFSKILFVPVSTSLIKKSIGAQKGRSKAERRGIQMECLSDLQTKHVIFIDDIVTSGATARSARIAVGPCRSFQVWCLAYRRQLAAHSVF